MTSTIRITTTAAQDVGAEAIVIAIRLDSEGPVLYVSERIGLDGKRFRFLKFRTMVKNADSLRGSLLHLNERQGNLFKLSNDPRFEEKFWDVIGLYLDPPAHALVLCCDEKNPGAEAPAHDDARL